MTLLEPNSKFFSVYLYKRWKLVKLYVSSNLCCLAVKFQRHFSDNFSNYSIFVSANGISVQLSVMFTKLEQRKATKYFHIGC